MTGDIDIDQWVSRLRVDAEASARRRQRWLEQQQSENAQLVGVLRDLGDNNTGVVIDTISGGRHTGRVRGVGLDVCIAESQQRLLLVPIDNIAAVRAVADDTRRGSGDGVATGERGPSVDATLRELLVDQAADRGEMMLVLHNGERLRGRMVGVGHDVVSLRQRPADAPVHVALAAIAEAIIG